ncbi:MBG domain-containing protein [Paraflavitalea speifideaquila]|uniref:MBG domain-containing protein n=1 Tax=Paraflavitalea speifideaquila TaxID=3076558 RepID=UPI0028E8BE7C|nr:MBG domain-containing protein [Paraflavitalea speifideiaquila]
MGVGTTTITAAHAGDANYEPASDVTQLLTVNKAPLTIRADNKTRLVGQANPALTISYTGFVNNETNTVFTTQPVISTLATPASPTGDYAITVTGAAAANYTLTYVNGNLTVTPLPAQTITFDALPVKKYGDAAFGLGGTASSGLPVSYASNNTSVAVIENGNIRIVGAGNATITASQAGNAFNAPAPDVVRTLTVQKVNLVIQAKDTSKMEGQGNPPLVLLYNGFVNGDDASRLTTSPVVSTVANAGSLAGRYTITVTGAVSSNYNIAQLNGTLTVLPPQGASQDHIGAYISSPGKLQVNIYSVEAGKAAIQLFDQYGTRMLQVNVTLNKGANTYQLSTGNVVAGVYHVRVAGPGFLLKTKVAIR